MFFIQVTQSSLACYVHDSVLEHHQIVFRFNVFSYFIYGNVNKKTKGLKGIKRRQLYEYIRENNSTLKSSITVLELDDMSLCMHDELCVSISTHSLGLNPALILVIYRI